MEPELLRFLGTIIGGGLAGGIALFIRYLSGKAEKRRKRSEKLERAFLLSQEIYDSHSDRIDWLKTLDRPKPHEWFNAPRHPGSEMAELKYIIRGYFGAIEPHLLEYYRGHQCLKDVFRELREQTGEFKKWADVDQEQCNSLKNGFEQLERGTRELKARLGEALKELA
ncbi:hypothetical protein TRP8649_03994 [Pelagimonas phthalicica]|uniref:Uncharacterized protein n=1 Tax=Pelagimonas phthalicica TaxID=1037362 RepID=A0A238JHC7_9RHOB|nr:hypothetical protein [Pelagimonas phthalicica]TDS89687.1 hypothetical protein CLV87_3738 [Pelagimonas phthalicica]SMX29855.1 hypothetical protein TRP8649_03994 [Pelagimonas phthalicica]